MRSKTRRDDRDFGPDGAGSLSGVFGRNWDKTHVISSRNNIKTFVLLDQKLIKHCLVTNVSNYRLPLYRKKLILGDSIVNSEGEKWRIMRENMAKFFGRGEIGKYSHVVRRETVKNVANMADATCGLVGLGTRITLSNLSHSLLDGAFSDRIAEIIESLNDLYACLEGLPLAGEESGAAYMPRTNGKDRGQAVSRLRSAVERTTRQFVSSGQSGKSLLGSFAALRRQLSEDIDDDALLRQITDDAIIFLVAGHETTASTFACCVYLLSVNPEALVRARAEARQFAEDGFRVEAPTEGLPFILACIDETLRLFPPVPSINRQAIADDVLPGLEIHAGAHISVPVRILHRMERFWEKPEDFRPQRFLPEERGKMARRAYIPFGIGPRKCLGSVFARQQLAIVIAILLDNFDLRNAGSGEPVPSLKIFAQPASEVYVELKKRGGN